MTKVTAITFYAMAELKARREPHQIHKRLGQSNFKNWRIKLQIHMNDALKQLYYQDVPAKKEALREDRIAFWTQLCRFDRSQRRLFWGFREDEEFTTTNQLPLIIAGKFIDLAEEDPDGLLNLIATILDPIKKK